VSDFYKLNDDHTVTQCSLDEWAETEEHKDRRVAYTELGTRRVSTVFLGFDHQFGDGPPLLFETMVFPSNSYADEYCEQYSTWDEAVAGHEATVKKFKDS
jgi:hypothetical protein